MKEYDAGELTDEEALMLLDADIPKRHHCGWCAIALVGLSWC
jgi:hypothetical protein